MLYTLARWTLSGLLWIALLTSCRGGPLPEQTVHRGVYHRVQRGQTLWRIAQTYGVNVRTLARVNRLSDAAVLSVGQRLYIPGAKTPRRVASPCPCKPNTSSAGISASATVSAKRQNQTPSRNMHLIWPLAGTITRGFKQGGKHRHDGIDIAAPKATPIRAAADGEVIFSDWGPGGYGRIVILRHDADLVTVYAHNHRNLVRVGHFVRQGEAVATVGKSGRASGYHLHFEIRRKTVPISPFKFLSRSRQIAQID